MGEGIVYGREKGQLVGGAGGNSLVSWGWRWGGCMGGMVMVWLSWFSPQRSQEVTFTIVQAPPPPLYTTGKKKKSIFLVYYLQHIHRRLNKVLK